MSSILRKAENKDGPQLLELVKEVLKGYGLTINPTETDKDLSDLDKFYFNNKGWFVILEMDNKIIGSYGLFFMSTGICELRKMYLLKEYQGKGLGKLLMEDSITKAVELGYTEMILETNKKLDTAIFLYRKYGFEEFKSDHLSDRCDFAMKKSLI